MNHIKTLPNGDTEGFSVLITGMVPEQPEALKLADELMDGMNDENWNQLNADAAAKLRRLHAENELLHKRCQQAHKVGRQSMKEDIEALLRQALEALEMHVPHYIVRSEYPPIVALRTALAEQPAEQSAKHGEPVAWLYKTPLPDGTFFVGASAERLTLGVGVHPESIEQPLYTTPQPAEQEPVAWMYEWNGRTYITTTDQRPIEHAHPHFNKSKPLYTSPQPAKHPFLVRDIAELIGSTVPAVCNALEDMGIEPRRSTNAAVTPDEALAVARRLAQPAKRVPLTRDRVKEILVEAGYEGAAAQHRADFINGLRHGELAHGITGENK